MPHAVPNPLPEQFQLFTFDASWSVFYYDSKESGYHEIRDSVPGSKSCDFIGIRNHVGYLIEGKDFRGYRIQNKARISNGELAVEVAQKVRDTLAGIGSGVRRGDAQRPWNELLAQRLGVAGGQVTVVLSLEDDSASQPLKWKSRLSTLANQIKAKLDWLRVRVSVVSPQTNPGSLPGVTVSNLPGACGHAAKAP